MQTATHAQRKASIVSALPSWVPRENLTVPDNLSQQYRFTFDCPCGQRPRITARIPKAGASHQEMLSLLLKRLDDSQHGICGQHHAAYPRPESEQDAAKFESLQKENKRLATKKRQLDSKVELLTASNKKAGAAIAAQTEHMRQVARADNRRIDFDSEIVEKFDDADKSTALLSKCSGLIDTLKYWCRGSEEKLIQLIVAQIRHFNGQQLSSYRVHLQRAMVGAFSSSAGHPRRRCLKEEGAEEGQGAG
jgi:hypothetical protein